jgi:CO dehydrogenase nickel-insertion accessory protein CooC1
MSFSIALAGKGSAGKSTLMPYLIDALGTIALDARLLVIDADPHMSTCSLLGIRPEATLGTLRSHYERELARGTGLHDETRVAFAERQMGAQALVKADGFDLLALGHWEPLGSQCTVNRVLERSLEGVAGQYDIVLFDHEAGIEQMGRFASIPLDLLLLVATPEPLFMDVAAQILERRNEVSRSIGQTWLVLNRMQEGDLADPDFVTCIQRLPVEMIAALLPESPALRRLSRGRHSPCVLNPHDSWAIRTRAMCSRVAIEAVRKGLSDKRAA